jgi:LCP family protein required for cell wall assembly
MSGPGRLGRASDPVGGDQRHSSANEDGLNQLAEQMAQRDPARGRRSDTRDGGATHRSAGRPTPGNDTPVANEAGLVALGQQMMRQPDGRVGQQRRARKEKRRRRLRRGALIGVAVVLVVVAGGAGYGYYLTHDLTRVQVRGLNGALTTGKEAGTENILMVGSTSRCALKVQNPAYGLCSQGVNGVNSDVIMILHADPANHRLALLSIPRDLFIPNARSTGPNKIDAGLFQGLSQLVSAIEEDFGIPIQHTVSLNFDQFANVVDALGGINMSFPISVFDASSGLNVRAATCVHLDGTQALEVVRARHLQYQSKTTTSEYAEDWPQETLSDLARIRRDHEFLRVLATAVAKQGLGNPVADINLINSVKADLSFDQSWPATDMANLVLDFHSIPVGSVPQLTIPVSVVTDPDGAGGGLMYQGASYGDVEFPTQVQDQAAINQLLGIGPGTDSMNGTPLPTPASVRVSVVNGSGVYNQATDTASALTALGFHTVGVGDSPSVGDVAETVVYYGSRSATTEAAAEAVTRSMSGAVIMAYNPTQVTDGAQVTVVTGTQFAVDSPAAAAATTSTAATAAGGATTPTTVAPTTTTAASATVASATAAIQAPSPTTSGLEPWDPRACPAGASPTAPVPNPT